MRMKAFITRLPMLSRWLGTHWSRVTDSLIFHLCEQPFGRIRVRRSQHHRYEGATSFYHIATGYSPEVGFLLHGDLRGGIVENHQPHVPFGAVETPNWPSAP